MHYLDMIDARMYDMSAFWIMSTGRAFRPDLACITGGFIKTGLMVNENNTGEKRRLRVRIYSWNVNVRAVLKYGFWTGLKEQPDILYLQETKFRRTS